MVQPDVDGDDPRLLGPAVPDGRLRPSDQDLADIPYADPQVDHAAANTYDWNYDGTGNWPFNTAYAGRYGLESFVTRLRSLTEAEKFIAAGIPLVVSVSFKENELTGSGYSTNGHLMVIRGFTAQGDVIVNDPASHLDQSNAAVRTTTTGLSSRTSGSRSPAASPTSSTLRPCGSRPTSVPSTTGDASSVIELVEIRDFDKLNHRAWYVSPPQRGGGGRRWQN